MRADNSHHLAAAARQRSQNARHRAATALRRLDSTSVPVTFDAVAREARVSRSWLYTQPDLRAEIDRLRQRPGPRPVPDRQRASDASLRQRLDVATERIRHLEADNSRLRRALAEALGDNRTRSTHDTPERRVTQDTRLRPQATSPTPSATQNRRSRH